MEEGSIRMFSEQDRNKGATKYTSSFIEIVHVVGSKDKKYVEFYFYCNTNGSKKIPIELPITKPFYLLPYGSSECQQVKWMVATTEWIKYYTYNYKGSFKKHGTVPYRELVGSEFKGITMFYCYYKSCNYTLTARKGVFQSPGFPGEYPDGQLCSWKIIVPANYTITVHFTNFSLYENDKKDTLKFSKRSNGSFKSFYTFHSGMPVHSFPLTSKTDIEFVFHSDQANASSGFRAAYNIILSSATATPPSTTKNQQTTKPTSSLQTSPSRTTDKSSIKPKPPITGRQSFFNDCTATIVKKSLIKDPKWTGTVLVIVIPLVVCFILVAVILVVLLFYRCRSQVTSSNTSDVRTLDHDHLPLVVNPTYERGDILLNETTGAATARTALGVNDNNGVSQSLSNNPPDYEEVDCKKQYKTIQHIDAENEDSNQLEAAGDSAFGVAHDTHRPDEPITKCTLNPAYESVLTSPPLIEGNKLYESIQCTHGKAQ